jgi:hypothetical protein
MTEYYQILSSEDLSYCFRLIQIYPQLKLNNCKYYEYYGIKCDIHISTMSPLTRLVTLNKIKLFHYNENIVDNFKYAKISITSGNIVGNVFPSSATVPIGNTVYVNAVASPGYAFTDFTDSDGQVLSTEPEYKFIISEDMKIIANFEEVATDPATLSVDPTISKLLRVNRDDGNYQDSQFNQDHIYIDTSLSDERILTKIYGELGTLKAFASTAGMGIAKWVGVVIDTNESYKVTDIYYNGEVLPEQEFIDANNLGIIGDGAFILWLKAEELVSSPKTISVYTSDKQKKLYINFTFVPVS